MKKYKAIFFDLDGTLLPMDMKEFTNSYFSELCKLLSKYGVPDKKLIAAVWAGTEKMVKNDGTHMNEELFWETFLADSGIASDSIMQECDAFYSNEFNRARAVTGENPLAAEAISIAHEKSNTVVLATNPLFPHNAQISRIGWIGLSEKDFSLISSYETDRFCKPNPMYYLELCSRIGFEPGDCLMIGNDELEDMYAASSAGLDGYLVTDCLIPCARHPWQGKRGSFAEMIEYLKTL